MISAKSLLEVARLQMSCTLLRLVVLQHQTLHLQHLQMRVVGCTLSAAGGLHKFTMVISTISCFEAGDLTKFGFCMR